MKKGLILTAVLAVGFSASAQIKTAPFKATPAKTALATKGTSASSMKTTKDSASYALGYRIAQSLKGQGLQDVNFEMFKKGMAAGVIAKTDIPDSLIDVCIKNYQDKMSQEKIAINRAAGKAFLEANAKKEGVVKMTNGMQYLVLTAGTATLTNPNVGSAALLSLNGASLGNGTGVATNYTLTNPNSTVTINRAAISITASDAVKVYDTTTDVTGATTAPAAGGAP